MSKQTKRRRYDAVTARSPDTFIADVFSPQAIQITAVMMLYAQDTDTSQLEAAPAEIAEPEQQPSGARKPPRSRSAAEQPTADDVGAAGQRQRRSTRRQAGGGTTSAAADDNLQPPGHVVPVQPVAFRPKGSQFTADSDTLMEAVVKVSGRRDNIASA